MNNLRSLQGRRATLRAAFIPDDRQATLNRRLDDIAIIRRRGHLWLVPDPLRLTAHPALEQPYDGPDAA